jgi:hypothetical protein
MLYAAGCYVPPNNLSTLTTVKQAWNKCPRGHTPILLGNLKVNLRAPRDEGEERIAKAVEDVRRYGSGRSFQTFPSVIPLNNMGEMALRMRRGSRWICSQCDYFLCWVTNCRKFCSTLIVTTWFIVQSSPKFVWGM